LAVNGGEGSAGEIYQLDSEAQSFFYVAVLKMAQLQGPLHAYGSPGENQGFAL